MSNAYEVDSSGVFFGQPFFDSKWQGPIEYNGHIWVVAERDSRTQAFVGVFKSDQTYPGPITSFTPQDTAHAPNITGGAAQVFYPKSGGNLIYLGYTTGNNQPVHILTFDMNTGLYGSVISATGPSPVQRDAFRIAVRSNGHWVVGYDRTGSVAVRDVFWSEWSGASWSAGVRVSTLAGASDTAFIVQAGINATDDVIFYMEITVPVLYNYSYSVLSPGNVLTTPNVWMLAATFDLNQGASGGVYYCAANDHWFFPFCLGADSGIFLLKSGFTSSDPSVDTIETVTPSGTPQNDVPGPRVTMDAAETTIYVEWNISTTTNELVYAIETLPLTIWSAPKLIFNGATDTLVPSSGITPVQVERPTITLSSTGEILYTFGTFAPGPFGTTCDIQYFGQFSVVTPPLTISCPIGAGAAVVGVAYGPFDLNSTTSGGTPPYTFSLASGMLPPGVTLSPSGIITGVPTVSGVFEYSPRVMDSSSPVQSATTSAPCGVGVGAALSPCAGVIPQPSTDVQFELRRVYCTMKPAPRIPVRGS